MTTTDSQLRQMFIRATDEVIPPAPWLESRLADTMRRRTAGRARVVDLGALRGFGPSLRLTAGVIAILMALVAVAALLMGTRLNNHHSSVPAGRLSTVQSPNIVPFTPSPAVRDAQWPPGGPVPADLAGAWQSPQSAGICRASRPASCTLYLAVYTFQYGEEYLNPPPHGNATPLVYGNVVVNGAEIDFMSDVCTTHGDFGFERYTYILSGNNLVLTRAPGGGQINCGGASTPYWPSLEGTYTRATTP